MEVLEGKKNRKFLLGGILLVVVIVGVIVAGIVSSGTGEKKLLRQLELGNKYLTELNYEQALACFLTAIELDDTSVEAYLGAAQAYVELGDTDSAIAILEQGYEKTGAREISARLDELRKPEEPQEPESRPSEPTVSEVPEAEVEVFIKELVESVEYQGVKAYAMTEADLDRFVGQIPFSKENTDTTTYSEWEGNEYYTYIQAGSYEAAGPIYSYNIHSNGRNLIIGRNFTLNGTDYRSHDDFTIDVVNSDFPFTVRASYLPAVWDATPRNGFDAYMVSHGFETPEDILHGIGLSKEDLAERTSIDGGIFYEAEKMTEYGMANISYSDEFEEDPDYSSINIYFREPAENGLLGLSTSKIGYPNFGLSFYTLNLTFSR